MAVVFIVLAAGLTFAAWRNRRNGGWWIFSAFALLNAVAAVLAIASHDPYAWRLRPASQFEDEPNYRGRSIK